MKMSAQLHSDMIDTAIPSTMLDSSWNWMLLHLDVVVVDLGRRRDDS